MADNIAITAGSGTTIATDDCTTAGHTQIIKLAVSTDGSATLIPADSGGLLVNLGTNNDVTVTGSVAGDVAHDTGDSGSPVKMGAKAETSPAASTMVADGDRTNLYADLDGLQIVKPFTSYGDIIVSRVSNTDGAATALTAFGATASARNFITTIAVYNSSATNVYVDFTDGSGGTIIFTLPLPAYSGSVCNFPLPLRQPTANTGLYFDVSAATTTVYLSLIGFKSKA